MQGKSTSVNDDSVAWSPKKIHQSFAHAQNASHMTGLFACLQDMIKFGHSTREYVLLHAQSGA